MEWDGDEHVQRGTYTAAGIKAIADALARGSLTECNVRGNELDDKSAKELAKVATEKCVMLFGIKHDQKAADFKDKRLKPPDAILIANDLSVSHSLTAADLRYNELSDDAKQLVRESVKDRVGFHLKL